MNASTPATVLASYAAAAYAKDVASFTALYHDNVRIFDLWGAWTYDGVATWREAVTAWFDSLGEETVAVSFDGILINLATELSTISAIVTYAGVAPNGQRLRAMQNRLTWVLTKDGDSWRIMHEHTSAPVEPESMNVILQQ